MKPIPQRVGILCSSATCFSAVSASNGNVSRQVAPAISGSRKHANSLGIFARMTLLWGISRSRTDIPQSNHPNGHI
jgi:hypothetical protein